MLQKEHALAIIAVVVIILLYYKYTISAKEKLIKDSIWMSHGGDILLSFDDDLATFVVDDTVITGAKYSVGRNSITLDDGENAQTLNITKWSENPRMMSLTIGDDADAIFDVYRDELATDKKRW